MVLEINQKVLEPSGSKETGKICFKILQELKKTPAAEKHLISSYPTAILLRMILRKLFVGTSDSEKTKKYAVKSSQESKNGMC